MSYRLKRGFTLLELLVVVSIIGLVAGSFVVSTGSSRKKSRDQKRKADLVAIQSALELFFAQNKRYPTNCAAGVSDGVNSQSAPPSSGPGWSASQQVTAMWPTQQRWINDTPRVGAQCPNFAGSLFPGNYISAVPTDPMNNPSNGYIYRYRTNNQYADSTNGYPIKYELDAKLEVDTDVMANDNGNCNTSPSDRYELYNIDNALLGCL